jgi:hypothetical protein
MDFLFIVLGIGGLVCAVFMLRLASRASRMEREESDARVRRLQAMAVGSVLFSEPIDEPAGEVELRDDAPMPEPTPALVFDRSASAHPFVITVPAGTGRVAGSFHRTSDRSRT